MSGPGSTRFRGDRPRLSFRVLLTLTQRQPLECRPCRHDARIRSKTSRSSRASPIRALHHYDSIGLLVPSARSAAGYRLYDDDDLLRLQQILIGRELGLSLEAIRRSLDDPGFDRREALLAQRTELAARAERATDMIRAIDAALTAIEEKNMGTVDMKKIFDGFDPDQYADETKQRWGDTEAYKISAKRTKSYTEADWEKLKPSKPRSTPMRWLRGGGRSTRRAARDGHRRAASAVDRPLVLSV